MRIWSSSGVIMRRHWNETLHFGPHSLGLRITVGQIRQPVAQLYLGKYLVPRRSPARPAQATSSQFSSRRVPSNGRVESRLQFSWACAGAGSVGQP